MSSYNIPNEQLARAIIDGDDSINLFISSLFPNLEKDKKAILLEFMTHLTLEAIELGLNIAHNDIDDSRNNSAIVYLEGLIDGVNIGISAK